jgi:deoxycytidine triphosphate deaminase
MVISIKEAQKIVKNLSKRELNNPEGAGVDLRLGEVHRISSGEAFIDADGDQEQGLRSGFETELIYKFESDKKASEQQRLTLKPGDYFLVKTHEEVDIPRDVVGEFNPRSSLHRAGLLLVTTLGQPGYQGGLIFGLKNLGDHPVTLQMGARICSAVFYKIESHAPSYRGQHQGGRVTPSGIERQV